MPSRRSPPPRHQRLDHLCKRAMAIDQGRILELVLAEPRLVARLGLPQGPVRLLEQLPTEYQRGDLNADDLLRLAVGDGETIVHIEYQSRPDPRVAQRILAYQSAVVAQYDQPLLSVVFNVGGGALAGVELVERDWLGLRSRFVTVNLTQAVRAWPTRLRSPMALLLRMLVLGASEASLRQGLGELAALGIGPATCRDLLVVLSFLLDRKEGGDGSRHETIARELFAMLKLEDSWIYQEGVEQGHREGQVEALREIAVLIAAERFGRDEVGAGRIRRLSDPQQLSALIVRLSRALTLAEALAELPHGI